MCASDPCVEQTQKRVLFNTESTGCCERLAPVVSGSQADMCQRETDRERGYWALCAYLFFWLGVDIVALPRPVVCE